jgi:hypothetical protein
LHRRSGEPNQIPSHASAASRRLIFHVMSAAFRRGDDFGGVARACSPHRGENLEINKLQRHVALLRFTLVRENRVDKSLVARQAFCVWSAGRKRWRGGLITATPSLSPFNGGGKKRNCLSAHSFSFKFITQPLQRAGSHFSNPLQAAN